MQYSIENNAHWQLIRHLGRKESYETDLLSSGSAGVGNLYYQKSHFWPKKKKPVWSRKTYLSLIMKVTQTIKSKLAYQHY